LWKLKRAEKGEILVGWGKRVLEAEPMRVGWCGKKNLGGVTLIKLSIFSHPPPLRR
jgi:hypothetical protein